MISSAFTVIAPFEASRRADLADLLGRIGNDPTGNDVWRAGDVEGIHFACGAIIPRANGGEQLMVELNGDGTEEEIVRRAVAHTGDELHSLFSCCQDCPVATGVAFEDYLLTHVVRAGASHVGNVGRTRAQILDEASGTERVLDEVASARAEASLPATISGVLAVCRSAWHPSPPSPRRTMAERVRFIARLVGLVAVVVIAAVVLAPVTALAVVWLRLKERTDPVQTKLADPNRLRRLAEQDDQVGSIQNHLLSIVPIKPGPFRLALLRLVLLALDSLARVVFEKGRLGSIDSIHFAHWSIIDEGRTLLFVSNFDGSWESYLEDFIQKAHAGLTAVWSNALGFPRANWLVRDGATDGPLFKNYARCSQHEEAFWYQAYPALSVRAIEEATELRAALARGAALPTWLAPEGTQREGTTPAPRVDDAPWDTDGVQALVLAGHGRLPASRVAAIVLPDSVDAAKAWLATVVPRVTAGSTVAETNALHLAMTASGLRRLGVPQDVLDTFGSEFLDGLGTPHRSRVLGDLGPERARHLGVGRRQRRHRLHGARLRRGR